MNKVTVEFFHDVICSFCFPMSYRMRQLQKMMPEAQIVHRSYALVKSKRDFDGMFGSRAAAKAEILSHWEHANQNDDLHRFNIPGMRQADFPFPTSMKALTACKAAYFTAGDAGYWDVFDALQNALFVQNRNIEEQDVIDDCIRESGIDFAEWEQHYSSGETKKGVPCLIIDGKYIRSAVEKQEQTHPTGASCRLDGSKINCE